MDVKAAVKAVKQKEIAPVYLLYGTEKYQMDEFVALLENHTLAKEERDFALVHYDLADTPLQAVVEEAEMVPFMVPRKLIFVEDAAVFTAAKDSSKVEHKPDALMEYMKNPAEYSVIVFIVNQDKLDERKKVVKAVKASGVVLSFSPLGSEELLRWVEKKAKERGCSLGHEAAETIVRNAGTQLQRLAAEIDKLCLYAGEGGEISTDIVNQLVARSTEQNVFALVENIANLRLEQALGIFYELLKQKEEPIKIMALIARQFRIILQVKELAGQSYTQQQIASQLSLHPYAVKIAGEQARKFQLPQLRAIISKLSELDFQMKTGAIDKVLGLELFLLRLAA